MQGIISLLDERLTIWSWISGSYLESRFGINPILTRWFRTFPGMWLSQYPYETLQAGIDQLAKKSVPFNITNNWYRIVSHSLTSSLHLHSSFGEILELHQLIYDQVMDIVIVPIHVTVPLSGYPILP